MSDFASPANDVAGHGSAADDKSSSAVRSVGGRGLSGPRRPSALMIGAILIVAAAMVLGVLAFLLTVEDEESDSGVGDESSSGTLVVTIVNTQFVGSKPLDYELYLNGNLSASGTIPVADSAVIEKSLTWTGPGLAVLIHIVIVNSTSQPGDRSVTLTPGEIERVNIALAV